MTRAIVFPTLLALLVLGSSAPGQQLTPADADRLTNEAYQLANDNDFSAAIPKMLRALQIRRAIFGEASLPYAETLTQLGFLHIAASEADRAEPLFYRAAEVRKQLNGPNSLEYSATLNDLGIVYLKLEAYDLAEPRFQEALRIRENKLAHDDPDYTLSLYNLSWVYGARGKYDLAEPLLKRILSIDKASNRTPEGSYGTHLRNLATLYQAQQHYDKAESLMTELIAIDEQLRGKRIPGWVVDQDIQDMDDLGLIYLYLNRYPEAESILRRGYERCGNRKSPNDYLCSSIDTHLGYLYQATGRTADALKALKWAVGGQQSDIEKGILGIRDYIDACRFSLAGLVSVAAASRDPAAAKLAFEWALRRKMLGMDVTIAIAAGKTWYSDERDIYQLEDQIRDLKLEIRRLTLNPPVNAPPGNLQRALLISRAALARLQDELEHKFSRAMRWSPLSVETLQQQLPPDSALIEFLVLPEYDFKAAKNTLHWTPPHYVAFVLTSAPKNEPRFIDIGNANDIDRRIAALRDKINSFQGLSSEKDAETEYQGLSRELYDILFRRSGLKEALGPAARIFVSPDGELSRIAFEALNEKRGRYLAEDHSFVYLPAARHLFAAVAKPPRTGTVQVGPGTVIFAAPDYNLKLAERNARVQVLMNHRPQTVPAGSAGEPHPAGKVLWPPLKGAIQEAEDVKTALQGSDYGPVQVYQGADALQEIFRHQSRPRILHVATHGYFLPGPKKQATEADVAFAGKLGWAQRSDDPLLRSGLVFAGANLSEELDPNDPVDGWMTAADVARMDLTGTELVVLSACDTGLGDVKLGDGVQGLQQSFLTVGARSLVMSLYAAPDVETRELMRNFYGLLAAHVDKATALNKARLNLISDRRKKYGAAHPYYWGSFVFLGKSAYN